MKSVTIECLERGLALLAYLIVLDGAVYAPLFDRLEREIAAARKTEDIVVRAKLLLETRRRDNQLAIEAPRELHG